MCLKFRTERHLFISHSCPIYDTDMRTKKPDAVFSCTLSVHFCIHLYVHHSTYSLHLFGKHSNEMTALYLQETDVSEYFIPLENSAGLITEGMISSNLHYC